MRVVIILLSLFLSEFIFAQTYTAIKDSKVCKQELEKKHQSIKSVESNFTESTHSSVLTTPQKGSGKMYYQKEGKIRWEKTKPNSQIILMNGKTIRIQENGKEVSDATTKTAMKRIQSLMVKMMTGSFLNDADFTISYFENSSNYKLVLSPKNEKLKRYISEIELIFKKSDLSLKELSLEKNTSNKIVYSFSGMKYNETIDNTKFTNF